MRWVWVAPARWLSAWRHGANALGVGGTGKVAFGVGGTGANALGVGGTGKVALGVVYRCECAGCRWHRSRWLSALAAPAR